MKCEKCKDSEARLRHAFGYVQCGEGGSRWVRYWFLCLACHKNAKIATEGKQWPLWIFQPDGSLKKSDKTIWPTKGRGYNVELPHPSGG